MRPEQQRIAIAEACPSLIRKDATGWSYRDSDNVWIASSIINDLNAMHEAEKVLTKPQFQKYLDWLDVSCGGELELSAMIDGPAFGFSLVHAAASQRAEAFLITLNLWEP